MLSMIFVVAPPLVELIVHGDSDAAVHLRKHQNSEKAKAKGDDDDESQMLRERERGADKITDIASNRLTDLLRPAVLSRRRRRGQAAIGRGGRRRQGQHGRRRRWRLRTRNEGTRDGKRKKVSIVRPLALARSASVIACPRSVRNPMPGAK